MEPETLIHLPRLELSGMACLHLDCTHSYLRTRPTAPPPLNVSGRWSDASNRASEHNNSTSWPVRRHMCR
eukprot:6296332-Prymnesium_polylepis.1